MVFLSAGSQSKSVANNKTVRPCLSGKFDNVLLLSLSIQLPAVRAGKQQQRIGLQSRWNGLGSLMSSPDPTYCILLPFFFTPFVIGIGSMQISISDPFFFALLSFYFLSVPTVSGDTLSRQAKKDCGYIILLGLVVVCAGYQRMGTKRKKKKTEKKRKKNSRVLAAVLAKSHHVIDSRPDTFE